jgi:prolipoprotein diacylglyceryltransferase
MGLAVGQMIGRFGCIAVGEHLGGPTNFFLGMHYLGGVTVEGPLVVGQTYHNAAIYEVIWLIPVIVALFWLDRRGARPGVISATFLISYGVLRFLTDFVRTHDERVLGLTGAQYMCLVLVPFGLWVLWTAYRPVDDQGVVGDEVSAAVDGDVAETDLIESSDTGVDSAGVLGDDSESESPSPS